MAKKLGKDAVRYRDRVIEAHWLKKNKCNVCGLKKGAKDENGNKIKFELDHINPEEKSYTITEFIKSFPWEEVLVELDKCQLLCYDCHKKKTAPLKGKNHGLTMLRTGCKCEICKKAGREYMKEYRKKKRGVGETAITTDF